MCVRKSTPFLAGAFGTITKPPGVNRFGSNGEIGILVFLSNLLQLGTVIAGLWVLLNFILAGFEYISSQGDSGAHAKVREKITNSVIGLIIIAVAYTLVAVIGLILFGEAGYFLNPTLVTPSDPVPGVPARIVPVEIPAPQPFGNP